MNMAPAASTSRKPRRFDGTMRFGVFWPYSRAITSSALISERSPDFFDLDNHYALAHACEDVGLDMALIADGYMAPSQAAIDVGFQDPRLHAILGAVPLIMATRHLGIVSTIHTTYFHPTHIARFAGQLDWMSGGRWGWNIVNGFREYEAKLFGFTSLPEHDRSYELADECVRLVEQIWQGQAVDFAGEFFTVEGRLAGPHPPERPLLVSAASSARGREFASQHCDYLFAALVAYDEMPELTRQMRQLSDAVSRAEPPEILVPITTMVRDKVGQAQDEFATLIASQDEAANRAWTQALKKMNTNVKPSNGLNLVGTATEVADEILQMRDQFGLNGILFRLLLWQRSEIDRMQPVFERLAREGVWISPATRDYCW